MQRVKIIFTPVDDPHERPGHYPDPPKLSTVEFGELEEGHIADGKSTGKISLVGVSGKTNEYAMTAWSYVQSPADGTEQYLELRVHNYW